MLARKAQAASETAARISTGIGRPRTSPANRVNSGDMFETGFPPLTTRASPRATVIIPSVTMNGATRPRVTTSPLVAPQAAPARIPISTGTTTG